MEGEEDLKLLMLAIRKVVKERLDAKFLRIQENIFLLDFLLPKIIFLLPTTAETFFSVLDVPTLQNILRNLSTKAKLSNFYPSSTFGFLFRFNCSKRRLKGNQLKSLLKS